MTEIARSGSEFVVNTETASLQGDPVITRLADGGFVVSWVDLSGTMGDNSSYSIKAQIYTASGVKLGTEFLVNTQTLGMQLKPSITGLSNGDFVVSWRDYQSDGARETTIIKAQIFSGLGEKIGAQFIAQTGYGGDNAIAALSDGGFVATWGNSDGINAQVYSASGEKLGSGLNVNTDPIYAPPPSGVYLIYETQPAIAGLVGGGFVISWLDGNDGAEGGGIDAQIFTSAGTAVGTEFRVNTETAGVLLEPSVASLSDGRFVVVWEAHSQPYSLDDPSNIKAQILNAEGVKLGGEIMVNTYTSGSQYNPKVSGLSDGGFAVSWDDGYPGYGTGSVSLGDASESSVKAQVFSASGQKVGTEFLVNTETASYQYNSAISGLTEGSFTIAWQDGSGTLGDASGTSIKAQMYTVDHPRGDGLRDIVLQHTSGPVLLWDMDGLSVRAGSVVADPGSDWQTHTIGDVNGDGFFDILLQHTTGAVVVWTMSDGMIASGAMLESPGADWQVVNSGDFDGDGRSEVLIQHTTGQVAFWRLVSDGLSISSGRVVENPPFHRVQATGDLNGDGTSDIVLLAGDGSVVAWTMKDGVIAGGALLNKLNPSWRVAGSGDFDGDGRAEILIQHEAGQVAMWHLASDGLSISSGAIVANPDASWIVTNVGNLDGDGQSDIVLQHTAGPVLVWQMDGATISAGAIVEDPGPCMHVAPDSWLL